MGEFIIQIIIGLIIIIIGILNMKGNISLLHSYHRKRVKKEDIIPFEKKSRNRKHNYWNYNNTSRCIHNFKLYSYK